MRHANTKTVFDFWSARRGAAAPQTCAPVDPGSMKDLFGRLFVLERMDRDHHVFAMAGGGLCDIHQRSFEGQNFLALWRSADRAQMTALVEGALQDAVPAFALAEAKAMNGRSMAVEIGLFPLRGTRGRRDRHLGLYQPLMGGTLGDRPPVHHVLLEARRGKAVDPARAPAANDRQGGRDERDAAR